ncbi:AMP-binding protein [Noviherbaspirillum galbum]|uniref:AMP-binding protein n=1 Tax=Noviherbaspirillum galbum TaxID=2709383 RepID=A0A6B3SW40_9BURK|nr:AMP-binding protein [Noviherbaspirillum galbum]NEX64778.1 AMP-binding protein [Noviherbaspirillum galbum]
MQASAGKAEAGIADWWEDGHAMHRFVCDLVASELAALRPAGVALPARPWAGGLDVVQDLGADSLELLSIATAFAECLHMHESGLEDYLLARTTIQDWVGIAQAALRHFSSRLTFRTSGSTGTPKPCSHPMATLEQEVRELALLFPGRRRLLSAVPSHHIYGFLFTVLLPRALGIDAAQIIDLRGSSPARLARQLQAGDLVVGHPEFWRASARLMHGVSADVVGVTSTAPCPDTVSHALQEAGLDRLVQIYGSSETAGIGWRDRPESSYRLFGYWKKAGDEDNHIVRALPEGGEVRYACPDLMRWTRADAFLPAGRLDNAVQVGGINVFPSKVREVLMRHPDVLDAAVRLMRPEEGNRLKAFIVPRAPDMDRTQLHERLTGWASGHLSAAERPKAFSFGSALPRSELDKQRDWDIVPVIH